MCLSPLVVRFRRAVVKKRVAAVFLHTGAAAEHRRIARDSYVHLALSLLWFLRRLPDQRAHVADMLVDTSAGDSALAQFQAEVFEAKRNAIVMTGHVGESIELLL